MKHENDKRTVTLEDLLKLKRAERPSAEFWGEFDRQLRAKQLRALVEKRPWWHGIHAAFQSLGRYRLPIGAVSAIALTFFIARDRFVSVPLPDSAEPVLVAAIGSEPLAAVASNVQGEREMVAASIVAPSSAESSALPEESHLAKAAGVATTSMVSEDRSGVSAFQSFLGVGPIIEEESPSARFIASNLAAIQVSDFIPPGVLAEPHGFESRGLPARAQEPLQQMMPPGESRRSTRYLATLVSLNSVETSSRTTERAASRLSHEELYDQVQRFGARRGGFNVKF